MRLLAAATRCVPDAVVAHAFTHPPRFRTANVAPRSVHRRYHVTEYAVGGGNLVTAAPARASDRRPDRHLVHLHGGAYTLQDFHWPLLRRFLDRGWTVSLVDYPLAPEHTVADTVPMVETAWRYLAATADAPLILAGDSAGGGLALVLLQRLRDLAEPGLPLPAATVLVSPWVDLVLDDAETVAEARRDPVLSLTGLRGAARLYAGGRDLADPVLSPVNGDLHDLGRVQAWVGTREMFWPQCRLLADRAAAAPGTDLTLQVAQGAVHDWPLFGVPEARWWLEEALAFLDDVDSP